MTPTTKMMMATAAFLAVAATGSAQSLKAEIPFAFEAGKARMQPGSYQVRVNRNSGGAPTVQIFNYDDHNSVLVLPRTVDQPSRTAASSSNAVLTFECTDGHCALARIWDGSTSVYAFPTPKPGSTTHIATVMLRSERGD